jgi:putative redox protein
MKTDKSKTLTASISLLNEKLHFEGNVEGNEPISIDYTPPLGDNLGYTSLELFLLSLSSCAGSAILVLLRKMNKKIDQFEIATIGNRKENHPTGFSTITMQVKIKAKDINSIEMEKVLEKIEAICPVLSMLDKSVKTRFDFKINE